MQQIPIMTDQAIARLQYLLDIIPGNLSRIPDADFNTSAIAGRWSKKEILGHLADSACNNHQRLIRAQYEDMPSVSYAQDEWVRFNHYGSADRHQLLNFWTCYNQHLLHLIKQLSAGQLLLTCHTGAAEPVTLSWLINDYVSHLEHHLQQITDY